MQPQLQKVQPECMRVQPQLGRGPFVGLRWSTVTLRGRSFDITRPSTGLRGTCVGPGGPLSVGESFFSAWNGLLGLRGPYIGLMGPCAGLKNSCTELRRYLWNTKRTPSGTKRPSFCLKGPACRSVRALLWPERHLVSMLGLFTGLKMLSFGKERPYVKKSEGPKSKM